MTRNLYQVFHHLHPYDLLHLARTTKTLRKLLMARSASTIWRRARENVPGLPDCPKDMSEPAYANLLFDPHCHVSAIYTLCNTMGMGRVC